MQWIYGFIVLKKKLSQKARLFFYRSIYIPILTYGQELWVMTKEQDLGYKQLK